MKKILYFLTIVMSTIIFDFCLIYANPRLEYGEPLKTYTNGDGLNIVSYSKRWSTEKKLKEVYLELLNNFNGKELRYLANIYIYPDSPEGINGAYHDDAIINKQGKYIYGNNAYIEIFNADEYYDISQMASTLAHEYGHHFTFYYITTSEHKYYNEWYDTEYARIRQLDKYKEVDYANTDESTYLHEWDITEIVAEDYVQLFGSPLSKQSTDFKDVSERLKDNIENYVDDSYNLLPQENLNLPLASDVKGLYTYWLNISGYTAPEPSIPKKPIPYMKDSEIVYFDDNKKYTLTWNQIDDGNIYEYTVIMYPVGMPYFPIPIKTVRTGEEMLAHIGSDKVEKDGEPYGILEIFEGEYEIKIFIKDVKNFMFASETLYYNFTTELSRYDESDIKYILNESNYINKQKRNVIKSEYINIPFKLLKQEMYTDNLIFTNTNIYKDTMSETRIKGIASENSALVNYYDYKKYTTLSKDFVRIPIKLLLPKISRI